jgi:tripartite-type tricarboxylate transporter receptor subunit TctC
MQVHHGQAGMPTTSPWPQRESGCAAGLCPVITALLCALLLAPPAAAQNAKAAYPSRPLHLVVPQTPGGAVDLVARMLADRIEVLLGRAVVVENRPGANGIIGTEAVKNAAPDGYTLLAASSSTHAMAPHTMTHIPYDALGDFVPIVNVAYTTKVVMVHPTLPVRTLAEFIRYARERPGLLNYGSTGRGSSTDLDVQLFAAATELQFVHVPYRGAPQANTALVNNEVQLVLGSLTTALGLLQSGRLRALAVVSDQRSPLLPDVPTIGEAGLPGFEVQTWIGLVAPAGTPEPIVAKLNRAVNEVLRQASTRRWMDDLGLVGIGGSARDFDQRLRADYATWGEAVRRLALQPE